MEEFINKRAITVYWIVLLAHCIFQYYELPYRAITKPMLVPVLLLYLLLTDKNIGKPVGKLLFYIGLFFAFFGDVFLVIINDTFFLTGMIAFMLMNTFYSISFLQLNKFRIGKSWPVIIITVMLLIIGYDLFRFLKDDMGDYKIPVMIYMFTVSVMIIAAVNIAGNIQYRKVALNYFIPGAFVFLIENVLLSLNKFHFEGNKDIYLTVMVTYGVAQYLLVKGVSKAYA